MHFSIEAVPPVRALRRFCRRVGELTPCVLALSWADMNASRGPARTAEQRKRTAIVLHETARVYYEEMLPLKNRRPLINGHDLIELFHVPEGPLIGIVLERVQEAQLAGTVQNREDALQLAREELDRLRRRSGESTTSDSV
jgi:hypothetical protein